MIATRWPPFRLRSRPGRLHVPAPAVTGGRVSVRIPGGDLWFECDDAEFSPSMEAFLGVLVLPAMTCGVTLSTVDPVDPVWLAGARRNVARYTDWWGYRHDPLAELRPAQTGGAVSTPGRSTGPRAGLCFTGGIDSFHELLRIPGRFSHLMFLHGPDIALDDVVRARHVRDMLIDVAAHTASTPVWVQTNLQLHPFTRRVPWDRHHGSGLAAVGHLLRAAIGSLTISASFDARRIQPWGSHPETDPDWSNRNVQIIHGDYSRRRAHRLGVVADHPLVRRYLRVCTKKRTPTGNCSTCRKCLLTMTHLAALGKLDQSQAFDTSIPLVDRLDALANGGDYRHKQWCEVFTDGRLPPDVAAAVTRLIERSGWTAAADGATA